MIFRLRLGRQDWSKPGEHIQEVAGIAAGRVALLLQRENGHGEFGEILQRQVIELAAFRQVDRRIEIVAPEAAAVADAYLILHR